MVTASVVVSVAIATVTSKTLQECKAKPTGS